MNKEQIKSCFLKRTKITNEFALNEYLDLCLFEKIENFEEGEIHHILPRSLFPEYEDLNVHDFNGVKLSYKNHLIAHFKLALAIDHKSLLYAFNMMNNFYGINGILDLNQYEELKIKFTNELKTSEWSKSMKGKTFLFKDGKFITVKKGEVWKYLKEGYTQKSPSSGTIWKNNGKISKRVNLTDEKYANWDIGRLETKTKNKTTWITKNGNKKRVLTENVEKFLDDGWEIGSGENVSTKKYVFMNKNNENISIHPDEVMIYLQKGWSKGSYKVHCGYCHKELGSKGKHNHKCKGTEVEYFFYTK